MDVLADANGQVARALATIEEEDPTLREQAREALLALRRPDAWEAVCGLAIEQAHPLALEVALAGGFASDPARRAVLLYLAGEFDRYAELDFDGTLLAAVHATASEGLRARLAERARESGRVQWVRVLAGRQARRIAQLSDTEWETNITVLTTAGQWDQLWRLALQAPPIWGAVMLGELGHRDWHPQTDAQRALHHQLNTSWRAATRSSGTSWQEAYSWKRPSSDPGTRATSSVWRPARTAGCWPAAAPTRRCGCGGCPSANPPEP